MTDFPFVSRGMELQALIDLWEQVQKSGSGPRVATILGEAGYGKTRLVREFYACLAGEAYGKGNFYWPNSLPEAGERMDINPVFPNEPHSLSIPWLWWGIRCSTQARNAPQDEGCAFVRAKENLVQHTGLLEKRRAQEYKRKRFIDSGVSQLLKFAEEVPGLGTAIRAYSSGKDWLEFFHSSVDAAKKTEAPAPGQKKAMDVRNCCDICVQICQSFLDPKKDDLPSIPMVLVVDDAHGADPLTIRSIYQILHYAYIRKLPLLLLATCLAKDWKSAASGMPANLASAESWQSIRQIEAALPLRTGDEMPFRHIECGAVDCAAILEPLELGLGGEAKGHFLQFADGNPRILRELLSYLQQCRSQRGRDWWFAKPAPDLELNGEGFAEFLLCTRSREEFLAVRVEEIKGDANLSALLEIAALQGRKFLGRFTAEVAAEILGEVPAVQGAVHHGALELLRSAETPFHVIKLLDQEGLPAEFLHRSFHAAFLSIAPQRRRALLDSISLKTAEWMQSLPPGIENTLFFEFAANWFRENGSPDCLEKALAIRAAHLLELGRPQGAVSILNERLGLAAAAHGEGSAQASLAKMEYAKALAAAGNFQESIAALESLREVFSGVPELWVDCSRTLARVLLEKSGVEGEPKQSFATAIAGMATSTPERRRAAEVLLEVWCNVQAKFGSESLDVLIAGLELGNAITEGADDSLLGADQRLLVYPCAAEILEKYGGNDGAKDIALSALGAYLSVWSWKTDPPRQSAFPQAERFYTKKLPSVHRLQSEFPDAVSVFKALRVHRERVLGGGHPATISAKRLETACEPSDAKFHALISEARAVLGEDHIQTLECEADFAEWLGSHRDRKFEAASTLRATLGKARRHLGTGHPWTLALQSKTTKLLPDL